MFRLASYMTTEEKFYNQISDEEQLEYNKRKLAVMIDKQKMLRNELALNSFMKKRNKAYLKFDQKNTFKSYPKFGAKNALDEIHKIGVEISVVRKQQTPLVQKLIVNPLINNQKVSVA